MYTTIKQIHVQINLTPDELRLLLNLTSFKMLITVKLCGMKIKDNRCFVIILEHSVHKSNLPSANANISGTL